MGKPKTEKEKNQNIHVAVRCRPVNSYERKQGSYAVVECSSERRDVTVKERLGVNPTTKTFVFDHVFPTDASQMDVYKSMVIPVVDEVLLGYNCTIFAYGQTGTGKTFTMEGERTEDANLSWEQDPLSGIVPRTMKHVFDVLTLQDVEFSVRVSYLELYNEELFDLLGSTEDPLRLRIYEDSTKKGSVIIQGLEDMVVRSKEEIYQIMARGSARRQTAATLLNSTSSRSHTVFSVTIHIKENTIDGEELLKTGKLYLVDLAGSENIGRSGAVDKRAREAGNINQSLLTLGRVITALVEHAPHVPYRESKLTRLLQDSLGGRTKTSIIATISPASCNLEETLSTLDYAHRAKNITNRPEINQKLTKKALLREYTEEIERMRRDLQAVREKNGIYIAEENYIAMQSKLTSQEDSIHEMEEKITAMTDEMQKLSELFTETKKELEDQLTITTDNLVQTSETLLKTKGVLRETRHDRDQQRHLVGEHVKTDVKLFSEANQLLSTVEAAVNDVDGLHSKLDRKARVESHNEQCQRTFQDDFQSNMDSMRNKLSDFVAKQRTYHSGLTDNLESLVQQQNQQSDTLKHSLTELQQTLTGHVATVNRHQQDGLDALHSWGSGLIDTLNSNKDAEVARLSEVQETALVDMVQNMQTTLQTCSSSLKQLVDTTVMANLKQEETVAAWTRKLEQDLTHLTAVTQEYSTSQEQKIASLHRDLEKAQTTHDSLDTEMEHKLEEIKAIMKRKKQNFGDLTQQTREFATESQASFTSYGDSLQSRVEMIGKSSSDHQADLSALGSRNDTTAQNHIAQVQDQVETGQRLNTDLHDKLTQYYSDNRQSWIDHVVNVQGQFTSHTTDADNRFNTHHQHTVAMLSYSGSLINTLTDKLAEDQTTHVANTRDNTKQLTRRLDHMSDWSASMNEDLSSRCCDLETFLTSDIQKDMPTGMTPQRYTFTYPSNVTKMETHDVLLENFQPQNLSGLLDEVVEEDVGKIGDGQQVSDPAPATDDVPDNVSDAGSHSSHTSGVSGMSDFSTTSSVSRKSQKENKMKCPAPVKKSKFTNVNITPRGKTKLPLKSNSNSSN